MPAPTGPSRPPEPAGPVVTMCVDWLRPRDGNATMDMDVTEELRIGHGPGLPGVARRQRSWWRRPRALVLVLGMASLGLLLGGCGSGARTGALPSVRVQVGGPEGGDSMSVGVQLLLLLTVLSLVPAILMM